MNTGTKIRTALAIATSVNMALATIDIAQFGNETANLVYKVISVIVNAVVVGLVAYYNNDYTEVAAEYTGAMRLEKEIRKGEEIGVDIDGLEYLEDGDENE